MKRGRKAGVSVSHCSKCGHPGTDNRSCDIGHRKRGRMGPRPRRGFARAQRGVESHARVAEMHVAGVSVPEMARATGLRIGTVIRILDRQRRAEVARG